MAGCEARKARSDGTIAVLCARKTCGERRRAASVVCVPSGAASVTVNLSGTVYPKPPTGSATAMVAPGVQASLDLSDHVTHDASYTYSLTPATGLTEGTDYTFTVSTGDMTVQTSTAGVHVFVITITNTDGKTGTFTWTVTVGNAPTVTKGTTSTSGTGATVPAVINAGGLATTVAFKYGTAEGTYNLDPASLSGGSVAAGETAAAVGASLTGLTKERTYYFQWTAVNAAGTTVVTGSFFQPGDGLEFPGTMNGWAQSGTTTRDPNFGTATGPYFYTPAYQLAANACPEFKETKSGTWWGASSTRYANGAECHYTDSDTSGGNNTLGSTYAGYYTWRGRVTGGNAEYVIMYTEGAPVEVNSVTDNHAEKGTAGVTVTATLSAAPSRSEKVYVRYKIGSGSFELHEMSVTDETATYTIPGQGKGTTVEYYVLTSPHAYVGTDPDLCTLRGKRDTEGNFTYTTTLLPPRNCSVTMGYEKATLAWNLNAAGNAVMIVRYDGLTPSVTAPSDGASYPADTSQLDGFVVYGAYADTGANPSLVNVVSQGAPYTYVLYSVEGSGNSSKYSAGVQVSATTLSLATPGVAVVESGAGTLSGAASGRNEVYVVARVAGDGSFGSDPAAVAGMVKAQVSAYLAGGILPCAKHFPGIGEASGDSHTGSISLSSSLVDLKAHELVPFAAAVEAGVPIIMVGHVGVPSVVGSDLPSSLSSIVIEGVLRGDLGYDGLVVTDALNMGAVRDLYTDRRIGVEVLKAGADLILMPADFPQAYEGILEALKSGELTEERIDESVTRIVCAKLQLGYNATSTQEEANGQ